VASSEQAKGTEAQGTESLDARARALAQQGKLDEAEDLHREHATRTKAALGAEHPAYGAALHDLAAVQVARGKRAEAEISLRRALVIFEAAPGVTEPPYGQALQALAGVLGAQGKFAEAEELLGDALATQERALGPDHASLAPTLANLAIALVQGARLDDAEPVIARALGIVEESHGEAHPETARILAVTAQIEAALGRDDARATARRALTALVAAHGDEHPLVQDLRPTLEQIIEPSGDEGEGDALGAELSQAARALEANDPERAIAILEPLVARAREEEILPLEASACGVLAQALFLSGRKDEGILRARRALDIATEAGQKDAAEHFQELITTMEGADPAASNAFHAQIQAALDAARGGDPGGALRELGKLADEARARDAAGPEATLRVLMGQLLQATGQRDAAAGELGRALAVAQQIGDAAAEEQIRQMMTQLGV